MRALPFLLLTAAYFGVAFASYSQVAAEDAGPTTVAACAVAAPDGSCVKLAGR